MITKTKSDKSRNYVLEDDLMAGYNESLKAGMMTDHLAKLLMKMCERITHIKCFISLLADGYKEDLISESMAHMVKAWSKFDPKRGSRYYSFATRCILNRMLYFRSKVMKEDSNKKIYDNAYLTSISNGNKKINTMNIDNKDDSGSR